MLFTFSLASCASYFVQCETFTCSVKPQLSKNYLCACGATDQFIWLLTSRYQPQKDLRIRAASGRTIRISQFKLTLHVHISCTVCVFGRLQKTLSQKLCWHFSSYRNPCWYDKCLLSSHHVSRIFSLNSNLNLVR